MGRTISRWSVVAAFFLLTGSLLSAQGPEFSFTKVADTCGVFDALGPPTIDETGAVAFGALRDFEIYGVYKASNGKIAKIIENLNPPVPPYTYAGEFSMNKKGDVAFTAHQTVDGSDRQVIALHSGGATATIVSDSNIYEIRGLALNNESQVAYLAGHGLRSNARCSVFVNTARAIEGSNGCELRCCPEINNLGTVVFLTLFGQGVATIGSPKGFTEIVPNGTDPFRNPYLPTINNADTIAFVAGTASTTLIASVTDGVSRLLVESNTVGSIGSLSLNDTGQIAFYSWSLKGIFVGADPVKDKVATVGDSVLGSTLMDIKLGSRALNNAGQVAFWAKFEDGSESVLIATPITPQPSARFHRGDANGDETDDLSDVLAILLYLFVGVPNSCVDALDANDDGRIDVADVIGFLAYLFNQGFPPPSPFSACGVDPTPDNLTCESFSPCQG